ncbi:MAG TPA: phosphatase PAP2 family protein [Gaiellaceae bacterium]|nr:phosphatase PAP2 family protein [Gaiellaceae bacterium]
MSAQRASLAAAAAAASAFALLATLVVTGELTGVDQYAVDHWMPEVEPGASSSSALGSIQLYPKPGSALHAFSNFWTYPASPICSTLLLLAGCLLLYRRGRRSAAFAWPVVWVAANAVELLGKSALGRPPLHLGPAPLHGFDSSFPSGHTVRAVLLTVVLASLWRRAAPAALGWLVVALLVLVVNADHTPTDVGGGVLLALTATFAVRGFAARSAPVRLAYAAAPSR